MWDENGRVSAWSAPARWTMGLLDSSDWQAQWIGDATPLLDIVPAHNGYHSRFTLHPQPGGGLSYARGEYNSIRGKIVSAWKWDGDRFSLDVTIPANTSATVYVPAKDLKSITESGKPVGDAEGVKFLRMESGAALFTVTSGSYRFLVGP